MLDKKTGALTAKRGKVKESGDKLSGVASLDFSGSGDGGNDLDSRNEDDSSSESAPIEAVELRNELLGDDELTLKDDFKYDSDEIIDSDSEDITDEKRDINTIEDGSKIQIGAIRDRFKYGETLEALAEDYNLPLQEISDVVEDIMQKEAPKKKSKKVRTGGKVRKSEWNEAINGLCWYYE